MNRAPMREKPAVLRLLRPNNSTQSIIADYWELTKPEITLLTVIAALGGFLLGSPDTVNYLQLMLTLAGTALCCAGSGVLNHYVERGHDAQMRRTARRPLPDGRLSPKAALTYGFVLIICGLGLFLWVNMLTFILAALTIVLYLWAYTPLKRLSTYNTLVGTIPGALPALGGFTASTGTAGAAGWALFAILALWQMPHFLALAWMYRKDYARAGYQMLPVLKPEPQSTTRQTLLYTALLVSASIVPTIIGATGWIYLVAALLAGASFLEPAIEFHRRKTTQSAKRVLHRSILYIPVLVVGIALDRWIL